MPSRLQARAKNCRGRWLTVMGFGARAPNEGRGAGGSSYTYASLRDLFETYARLRAGVPASEFLARHIDEPISPIRDAEMIGAPAGD